MQQVVFKEDGFSITSYGNGFAYSVCRDEDGFTFFLQGEDAIRFCEEWESMPEGTDFAEFLSLYEYDTLLVPAQTEDLQLV